jgi:DNA-binding SARP family transcriptional activator
MARAEVARLEEARLTALEERLDADLALGRHHALIGELGEHVAAHPFRERLRAQQMLALYRSGRQAEALSAYSAARQLLSAELGLERERMRGWGVVHALHWGVGPGKVEAEMVECARSLAA